MKKKLIEGIVVLLVFGFSLIGCDNTSNNGNENNENEYDKYYKKSFRDNENGSIVITNPTKHDMLIFNNFNLNENNIIGGIRSEDTVNISFNDESDFESGGYKIIYAVKQSEYEKDKVMSDIDFTAMIPYQKGVTFNVTLYSILEGDYQFTVSNRNINYPMELRKYSPEGDRIAFLTSGESHHKVRTTSSEPFSAFPVWIVYNNITKSIISFTPDDSMQVITPVLPANDNSVYFFPAGGDGDFEMETIIKY